MKGEGKSQYVKSKTQNKNLLEISEKGIMSHFFLNWKKNIKKQFLKVELYSHQYISKKVQPN